MIIECIIVNTTTSADHSRLISCQPVHDRLSYPASSLHYATLVASLRQHCDCQATVVLPLAGITHVATKCDRLVHANQALVVDCVAALTFNS
jgi:hypothetical protein